MTTLTLLSLFTLVAVGSIAAAVLGPAPREAWLRRITALTVGAVELLVVGALAFVVLRDPGEGGDGYGGFVFTYPLLFAVAALVPFVAVHWWRRRRSA